MSAKGKLSAFLFASAFRQHRFRGGDAYRDLFSPLYFLWCGRYCGHHTDVCAEKAKLVHCPFSVRCIHRLSADAYQHCGPSRQSPKPELLGLAELTAYGDRCGTVFSGAPSPAISLHPGWYYHCGRSLEYVSVKYAVSVPGACGSGVFSSVCVDFPPPGQYTDTKKE